MRLELSHILKVSFIAFYFLDVIGFDRSITIFNIWSTNDSKKESNKRNQ